MTDHASGSARVLIVEDEPMIGRILEHKLRREGHAVTWVRSALEAEESLVAAPVAVALIDATLERDGIDLGRSLVAAGALQADSWLALVEHRDQHAQQRARDAGAAATVLKPFKPTQVAATVAAVIDAQTAAGAGAGTQR